MKKLLYIVPLLLGMALTSCYDEDIEKINSRLDAIENTQIATISQQITSINNSILLLNGTDKELKDYITTLEKEAENLQTQITTTNTKIDEVKTEVLSTISTEKANILAELEALRNTTAARLEEINATIAELKAADGDMSAQIEALEAEAAQLEVKLAETNTKIDTVKSELTETISTEKANILAELEAFRATVNGELEAIKAVLETLKAKDAELDGKIATLQEYVDTELKATEDWATATFATLEQYNEVVATIATIEGAIEGLNESIAALETRINEKIAKDIETACATLSADLQKAVEDITTAYTSAITTAKEEITTAYTAKLEGAISALETSMKEWVNEQLTAYSTIVSTEAKITALQSEMDGKLAAQKTYLEALVNALSSSVTTDITAIRKQIEEIEEAITKNAEEIEKLRGELAEQKEELTEAYTAAIAAAIAESEGKMSDKLAEEIAAINERIDKSDIAAIEALIANCKARMETAEADIVQLKANVLQLQVDVEELQEITEKLLAQIQSITYIPTYDDGKATIDYHTKRGTLDFQISPKSAINDLEKVWQTALSVKAVATQTRAVDFINLPITAFEADATNGTITIEVDGSNLGDAFFTEKSTASATIEVSDGNNCLNSAYLNLTANFIIHFEDKEVERLCVLNWDTDGDLKLSYEEAAAVTSLGTIFQETEKYYGTRIQKFNELQYFINITEISGFEGCAELLEIILPNNCISIGDSAFAGCKSLIGITIPNNVVSIGNSAFSGCSNLASIIIPKSVTSFGRDAFYGCTGELTINCDIPSASSSDYGVFRGCKFTKVIIGDSVALIGAFAFYDYNSSPIANVVVGNGVTLIGNRAFSGCSNLASITIPDSVTSIGEYAFSGCPNLTSVIIGNGVENIEERAFSDCSSLAVVYCKPTTPPALFRYYFYSSSITRVFPLNSGMVIYVPADAYTSYKQYTSTGDGTLPDNWAEYKSYIKPYNFE